MTPDDASGTPPLLVGAIVLGVVSLGLGAYLWTWVQRVDDVLSQVQGTLRRHLEKRL